MSARFQISIKYIAWQDVDDNIDMQFAFTATSWWQTYNSELSAPFRETNDEPEVIFSYNHPWELFGVPIDMTYLSLNHQSNGKGGELSQSWNRIIGGIVINKGPVIYSLKTWQRVPEYAKETPDVVGDETPHIQEYLGRGGFGESLIYYNQRTQQIGLGIKLTDWL